MATEGEVGVTAILTKVAGVTVRVATAEVTFPNCAVIFVVPVATLVARPEELMVAVAGVAETQVAVEVKSLLEPSE